MTKQKKAIWVILGIIIFVFSVFLGLGYLGQITGGNSLIQRTEMNDKYVPEEITKYYPIENLNSKENLLSDKNYANSIQDALLSASIEFEQGEEYKAHIDKVIKEFENENYKSVLYALRVTILLQTAFHSDWGATPFPISSALIILTYLPVSVRTAKSAL